jgi:hypothetical protein
VVKLLTKTVRGGENFSYGAPSVRAHVAKQFKTIKSMQADRGQLISEADMGKLKDEINGEFDQLQAELEPYKNYERSEVTDALIGLATKGMREFNEYYSDVPAETMAEVRDFLDKLRHMPSEYFEGKIGRAVRLNEFDGALVPKGKEYDAAVELLKRKGVADVRRYTKGDEADRAKVLAGFRPLLFSKRTDAVKDFFTGAPRAVDSLADIDTILNTGRMPQKKIDSTALMDRAATLLVDSSRPFDAFMRIMPDPVQTARLIEKKDVAKRLTAAQEKHAMDTFLKPLAKLITGVAKKNHWDYRAAQEIVGEWMTARYAIEKNADYIKQDQQAVDDAQIALTAEPNNPSLKAALTRAQNAQKTRADAIVEQRHIDPRAERLDAKLAGGYNDFTATEQMAKYEAKIPATTLEEAAEHVYKMLAWKTAMDLSTGKVTQAQVDAWQQSPHYVPLTGDPSLDTSEDELFAHGSINQSSDKRAQGRSGSIAQNAIDAAVEQVQKSTRYYGWDGFKTELADLYDNLVIDQMANGLNAKEAKAEVLKTYQLAKRPLTNGTMVPATGITYRKDGKSFVFDIQNQAAVDALKSINKDEIPSVLQPIANFTRLYARMVTQFLPGFGAINAMRDTWERTENIRTRTLAGYPNLDMNKVARDAIGNAAHLTIVKKLMNVMLEGTKLAPRFPVNEQDPDIISIREMLNAGATSTFGDYLASTNKDLAKQMQDLPSEAMTYISAWNNAFELVSSHSIYSALRSNGVDVGPAAATTLNMMNFGKSGTITGPLKALYVFTNPTLQGGHQLIQTLSTPRGKARALAYLMAGVALYSMLRAGAGDDDEIGENKLDNQGSFILERNIMIPTGENTFVKIPIGFGMPQAMWSAAINIVKMGAGTQSPIDTAAEIIKSFSRTLAPVAPSETAITDHPIIWAVQTFTPQFAKPVANVALDVNTFGAPLTNSKFAKTDEALALQGRKSTADAYKDIAAVLGGMGINMYPEQVREVVRGYAVGPLNEIVKAWVENPNREKLGRQTVSPIIDRFISKHDTGGLKERLYYRYIDEANSASIKDSLGEELTPREKSLVKLGDINKKLQNKANGKMAAATKAKNAGRSGDMYRAQAEKIRDEAQNLMFSGMRRLYDE